MRITILGSGPSSGVPVVGLGWGNCDPINPKNRRLRSSIIIKGGDAQVLVDTSPDLREQLLKNNISRLDAVLFTHAHADHVNGIDDLRGINRAMNAPIPGYADKKTLIELKKRFGYVLEPLPENSNYYYKPCLKMHEFSAGDFFNINGLSVKTIEQDHGFSTSFGFRIDNFAYTTDVKKFSTHAFKLLSGIDTWVIGSFNDVEHKTHASLSEVLRWIKIIGPKKAIITHMGPHLDYENVLDTTPDNVFPAYDGMTFDV